MNSSTHLPKHTLSSVADDLVVNASFSAGDNDATGTAPLLPTPAPYGNTSTGDGVSLYTSTTIALPPTVIEFDDSLATLWKQLRAV